jgi:hypothetical protein
MEYNAIHLLEKELVKTLKEEYSFYQSLYILIDKQRDLLKFDREDKLLDIYTEIERVHRRIVESEEKITAMRSDNPKLFALAVSAPEVRKLAQCILTLIKKNINLVKDNETYATDRYERVRQELRELQRSSKIVKYFKDGEMEPQFLDKKN